jgi:hypothetical protein
MELISHRNGKTYESAWEKKADETILHKQDRETKVWKKMYVNDGIRGTCSTHGGDEKCT